MSSACGSQIQLLDFTVFGLVVSRSGTIWATGIDDFGSWFQGACRLGHRDKLFVFHLEQMSAARAVMSAGPGKDDPEAMVHRWRSEDAEFMGRCELCKC